SAHHRAARAVVGRTRRAPARHCRPAARRRRGGISRVRIRYLTTLLLVAGVTACGSNAAHQASKDVHLDYAYSNPLSLVVRDQHLLENQGYKVSWVLSAGSNKANEGLRSKALDFGSTAGSAALVARANGTPIKIVDVYSKPEWTALVVGKNSTA